MADLRIDYTLPRQTGLTEATALRDQARQVDLSDGFCVDASQVEDIKTPMSIVLMSIDAALRAQGQALAVHNPTDPLITAFSDIGLYRTLMAMEFVG